MQISKRNTLIAIGCAVLTLPSCLSREFHEGAPEVQDLPNSGKDPDWIYNGLLPALEKPQITVSLASHTARITGLAPANYDISKLPHYARSEVINGRNRIMVVYPVATVDKNFTKPDGSKATNGPGSYSFVRIFPWNPKGAGSDPNTPWGGFPYIEYNVTRSLAFHGPIDSDGKFWRLRRGPVSHACNRMQGEHVTELAHLLGVNMSVTHKFTHEETKNLPILVKEGFDVIADGKWQGKEVDVDYPAMAGVQRPTQNVEMFKTWDGRQHPNWVCPFRKDRANFGMQQCADLGGGSPAPSNGGTGSGTTNPPATVDQKPNGKVCNSDGPINVRNSALMAINSADPGDLVKRLGTFKKSNDGIDFEEVFFVTPPQFKGFVAKKFLCNL